MLLDIGWALEPLEITVKTEISEIQYSIQNCRTSLTIVGAPKLEIKGAPSIPYKIINVAAPIGTKFENISVCRIDSTPVAPQMNLEWFRGDIRTDYSDPLLADKPDEDIYGSWDYFPGYCYQILNQGAFGDQPIVTLAIYPVQLRPRSGEIIVLNEIQIKIELSDNPGQRLSLEIPGSQIVQNSIFNRNYTKNLSGPPRSSFPSTIPGTHMMGLGAEYLLITSDELAADFYPYICWKNQKGVLAEIVIIDDILASYFGEDDAARLRNYLQDAFMAGAHWVLLGGDEDIIPIRYAYQANVSKTPNLCDQQICDLYYSDLTGDWDYDGDGVYGEMNSDQPDLFPEIYVGRVPAENSEEVQIWVEKALLYEQNPGHGDYSYLARALIISADQMRDLNEHIELAQTFPADFFVDISRCAEEPSGAAPDPTQPIAETVVSVMNEGWGFITNLNHGNFYAYSTMSPNYNDAPRSFFWGDTLNPDNGASSLTRLAESDKYSIYYSFSCEVAGFDFDKEVVRPGPFITNHTFMEAYLFRPDRAGPAFFGNTRWGWVSASFRLEQKFIELIYSDSAANLGVAEALSKTFFPNYRDIDYGHNLFGDPEMKIWRGIPGNLMLSAPSEISINSPSLKVLAIIDNEPAPNINICMWKPGELYIRGVTDQNGKFETPLSLAKSGQLYVTAVADNFIPALDTVMIREQVGIDNPVSTANQFYLADAYPNPFNSSTRIKFGCQNSGQIKLEIFDIAGRKVTTLADGNFEAGDHVLSWDGHDNYGRTVASGIYLYRLTDNGRVLTKKMILLK
jgi:hypothetical protein